MKNESGLHPVGRAVLIAPYQPERKKGLIEIPKQVQESSNMLEMRAVVIECGPAAWEDESAPRATPGDKVLVTKFAGFMAKGTLDGKDYRLINDRDIFCRVDDAVVEAREAA